MLFQGAVFTAQQQGRAPFEWKGADSDNGSELIGDIVYKYRGRESLNLPGLAPTGGIAMPIFGGRTGPTDGKSGGI
jgi:hypothetical protein